MTNLTAALQAPGSRGMAEWKEGQLFPEGKPLLGPLPHASFGPLLWPGCCSCRAMQAWQAGSQAAWAACQKKLMLRAT